MLNLQQIQEKSKPNRRKEKIFSCHWNMDSNGDAIVYSSSFWCKGKKLLNFSAREITYSNYVYGNFSNKIKVIFIKV